MSSRKKREDCKIYTQAIIKLYFQDRILTFSILFVLSHTDRFFLNFYPNVNVYNYATFIIYRGFYLNFI